MANKDLLSDYDSSQFEKMSVAVDILVFTIEEDRLKLLMIEREDKPFAGQLALPGVFVGIDETPDAAVVRGIREETGLKDLYFEQLYTFGEVDRDPRMRIISIAYMALVPLEKLTFKAGERTKDAYLVDVEELLNGDMEVAFDHKEIIRYARWRLANKVEYTLIAFHLVPEEFTLPNLQRVYEILLGKNLYKANFRKKIAEYIEETDFQTSGEAHRPSRLYRLKKEYQGLERIG